MVTTHKCVSCGKQYKVGFGSGWSNEALCRTCFRLEIKEKKGTRPKRTATIKEKAPKYLLAGIALSTAVKLFKSDRIFQAVIAAGISVLLFSLGKEPFLGHFHFGPVAPKNNSNENQKPTGTKGAIISIAIIALATAAVSMLLGSGDKHWALIGVGVVALSFLAASIRIADQWEKAVVLRMGKFAGLRGPGLFFILPVIDRVDGYIDQRVRITDFHAEKTLTKDTVPVDVDAVVYWTVWDAEKAALEVEKYIEAVAFTAQTGLRDIIGRHELADLLQNRETVAEALKRRLDKNTSDWGITCQTVGIKDIVIPETLSNAMSKQAQAERERRARIILGTAETEIAEKFEAASRKYRNNPVALQLRGMNMLFEGLKEKGSLIVVPSSALGSMNLGATGSLLPSSRQADKRSHRAADG